MSLILILVLIFFYVFMFFLSFFVFLLLLLFFFFFSFFNLFKFCLLCDIFIGKTVQSEFIFTSDWKIIGGLGKINGPFTLALSRGVSPKTSIPERYRHISVNRYEVLLLSFFLKLFLSLIMQSNLSHFKVMENRNLFAVFGMTLL